MRVRLPKFDIVDSEAEAAPDILLIENQSSDKGEAARNERISTGKWPVPPSKVEINNRGRGIDERDVIRGPKKHPDVAC
jgi:hypothetical protein